MFSFNRFALAAAILARSVSVQGSLEVYQNLSIAGSGTPPCEAAASDGTDTVTCTFAVAPSVPTTTTVYSKITEGSCSDSANEEFTSSETTTATSTGGLVTSPLDVSVSDAEKNCDGATKRTDTNGATFCDVVKTACARADVVDTAESQSVNAAMLDVTLTYSYASDGTFDVSVATAAFDPEAASAEATRTVAVQVFKGACGTVDPCELTGTDGATCYDSDPLAVGSTMELCIKPADSDVKVTGLQSVTVTPDGGTATTVVDSFEDENFVTTVTVSETERGVTLSTLMIPLYFDEQLGNAGSVSVSGTALLEYINAGSTGARRQRRLQTGGEDKTPFSIKVPVATKEKPQIAQVEILNGAMSSSRSSVVNSGLAGLALVGFYRALI